MPRRSFLTFCLAVACTFAAIGVVNDLFDLERSDVPHLILKILTSSGFAVLSILILYRRMPKLLIGLAIAQTLWLTASAKWLPAAHRVFTAEEWRMHVIMHGLLITGLILFSYGWFGTVFKMEGKRYFAAHTEIELASRIQEQLVPPINTTAGDVEIYGISIPSGTVGGDLLDVVEADGATCVYIADVAGHGVAAGVVMSMVKTAVRMHFMGKRHAGETLLEAVNDTLTPLTAPAAYATFAYLLMSPDSQVEYSVAAHLPIIHYQRRDGIVVRHFIENFPLAMFPNIHYKTGVIDFRPGDVMAIVTDGLTEVSNATGIELGDSYIDDALSRLSARSLPEISGEILRSARSFGKTADDQTLLLLRRGEST